MKQPVPVLCDVHEHPRRRRWLRAISRGAAAAAVVGLLVLALAMALRDGGVH